MPLTEDSQELFMSVAQQGLNTPARMPQGVTNATSYFQGTLDRVLGALVRTVCLLYVDDVLIWERTA